MKGREMRLEIMSKVVSNIAPFFLIAWWEVFRNVYLKDITEDDP